MPVDPSINILLVEDSAVMRKMQAKTLKDLGFTSVLEAKDGNDAVQKIKASDGVHLIISDWNMPDMDGYELLQWVRAEEPFRHIPFIMATAQSDKKQVGIAVEAGVSACVPKPFTPDELKSAIERAMSGEKEDDTPVEARQPDITEDGKVRMRMAHIQITDHLILGVARQMIDSGQVTPHHFVLETSCMGGWNPVQQSLETGEVDGAFILAPIAMDLYANKTPIKMTLLAHKNGSICVRNRKVPLQQPFAETFRNKTFYIPHKMSVHNMLSHMFFREMGLRPGMLGKEAVDVQFEVVPPIKMPELLGAGDSACGFMVAEPLGTKAIAGGLAELQYLSSELWPGHPCCVVAMRDSFLEAYPEAMHEFTDLLVKAGRFVEEQPARAAEIAVGFLDPRKELGLKVQVLKNVLTEAQGIRTGDLFPVKEDLDRIQQYMHDEMGIGDIIDIDGFVDMRFAEKACAKTPTLQAVKGVAPKADISSNIFKRRQSTQAAKSMLGKEGKYLTFAIGKEEYGLEILKVKEIIGMTAITSIPRTPECIKGVINLRGKVIPVFDMRLAFCLEERAYDERTCIIVLDIVRKTRSHMIGMVVDSVSEVLTIKGDEIEDAPSFGSEGKVNFIRGMAKVSGQVKILLDIDEVVGGSAFCLLKAA